MNKKQNKELQSNLPALKPKRFKHMLTINKFEDLNTVKNIDKWLLKKRGYVFRMPKPGTPVIVSFSGGLDSTVLLGLIITKYKLIVYPLYIYDQPRAERESKSARQIINFFKKKYPKSIKPLITYHNNTIGNWAYKNTQLNLKNRVLVNAVIDSRENLPLLHSQYIYQQSGLKIYDIFCGIQYNDGKYNPSQTLAAIRTTTFNMCVKTGIYNWQFCSLFLEKELGYLIDKHELIKIGNELKLPLEKTWSCFRLNKEHCGICGNCITRKQAFLQAGVKDKTIYLKKTYLKNPKEISIPTYSSILKRIIKRVIHY